MESLKLFTYPKNGNIQKKNQEDVSLSVMRIYIQIT